MRSCLLSSLQRLSLIVWGLTCCIDSHVVGIQAVCLSGLPWTLVPGCSWALQYLLSQMPQKLDTGPQQGWPSLLTLAVIHAEEIKMPASRSQRCFFVPEQILSAVHPWRDSIPPDMLLPGRLLHCFAGWLIQYKLYCDASLCCSLIDWLACIFCIF